MMSNRSLEEWPGKKRTEQWGQRAVKYYLYDEGTIRNAFEHLDCFLQARGVAREPEYYEIEWDCKPQEAVIAIRYYPSLRELSLIRTPKDFKFGPTGSTMNGIQSLTVDSLLKCAKFTGSCGGTIETLSIGLNGEILTLYAPPRQKPSRR